MKVCCNEAVRKRKGHTVRQAEHTRLVKCLRASDKTGEMRNLLEQRKFGRGGGEQYVTTEREGREATQLQIRKTITKFATKIEL